ncbi:MAG: archease [Candidatus Omnitrophica bacterium]|jgi:SHS2 domain-containing protein|nr:archease [Candidatus Omnitrophota bacterium]
MPYKYLDNIAQADIAFEAWGKNPEEMIISACTATENIMIENINSIYPKEIKNLHIKENSLEMLVFRTIEELIFFKDSEKIFLLPADINLRNKNNYFYLDIIFQGEKINPDRHNPGVDIKGITLHNFKVEQIDNQWKTTVILDI